MPRHNDNGTLLFRGTEIWTSQVVREIIGSLRRDLELTTETMTPDKRMKKERTLRQAERMLDTLARGPRKVERAWYAPIGEDVTYFRVKCVGGDAGLSIQSCPKQFRRFILPDDCLEMFEVDICASAPSILFNLARLLGCKCDMLDRARKRQSPFGNEQKHKVLVAIHSNALSNGDDNLRELHYEVSCLYEKMESMFPVLFSKLTKGQGSRIASVSSRVESIVVSTVVRFLQRTFPRHVRFLGCAGDAVFFGTRHKLSWDEEYLAVELKVHVEEATTGISVPTLMMEMPCIGDGPGLDMSFKVTKICERSVHDIQPSSVPTSPRVDRQPMPVSPEPEHAPREESNHWESFFIGSLGDSVCPTEQPDADIDMIPGLRAFCERHGHTNIYAWQAVAQFFCKTAENIGSCLEGKVKQVSKSRAEVIIATTILILNHYGMDSRRPGKFLCAEDQTDMYVYREESFTVPETDEVITNRLLVREETHDEFIEWLCHEIIPWLSLDACFRIDEGMVDFERLLVTVCGREGRKGRICASHLCLPETKFVSGLYLPCHSGVVDLTKGAGEHMPFKSWSSLNVPVQFKRLLGITKNDINAINGFMSKDSFSLWDIYESDEPVVISALYSLIAIVMVNDGADKITFKPDNIPPLDKSVLDAVQYILTLMGLAMGVVADFPVWVYFYGYAGAGKSMLMDVVLRFLSTEDVEMVNNADDSKHAMDIAKKRGRRRELATTIVNKDIQRSMPTATAEKLLDIVDTKTSSQIIVEPK